MNKALVSLILGIGFFSGCVQKEYTKKEIFNKIEKERTFSEMKYKKYSVFKIEDYESGIIEEYYDLDLDGYPDVRAMFEFDKRDKPVFIGIYQNKSTNFNFFYSDSDGDGILEEKIELKKVPTKMKEEKKTDESYLNGFF